MQWPQVDLLAQKPSNKHCFLVLKADESFNKDTTEGKALVWSPKEGAEALRQPHGSGKVPDSTRRACRITDGSNTRDLVLATQLLHTDAANGLTIDQRVMYFDCSVHTVCDNSSSQGASLACCIVGRNETMYPFGHCQLQTFIRFLLNLDHVIFACD
jgi:hypothetical protein